MRLRGATAAAAGLLLAGCATQDDPVGPTPDAAVVEMSATGFPAFAQVDGHFELWISFAVARTGLRHSTNASAGKFKIREGGEVVGLDYQPVTFRVNTEDPDTPLDENGDPVWPLAIDAFVSIEAGDDPQPDQPGPVLLGGAFLNGTADLGPGYSDALGQTFPGVGGSFLMSTPTTPATNDDTNGVWFVTSGGAAGSLVLPALPSGGDWTYEGWVSLPSAGNASLGQFLTAGGVDSDGAGPLGGTGYPFPGSDFPFAAPDVDLSPGSVFVTLEPRGSPEGSGPFFLELFGGPIPGGTQPGVPVPMTPSSTVFPTVSVTLPAGGQ